MEYPFLVVGGATKIIGDQRSAETHVERRVLFLLAHSREEAEGIAMRTWLAGLHSSDGWQAHCAFAQEVSRETLAGHLVHARPIKEIPADTHPV